MRTKQYTRKCKGCNTVLFYKYKYNRDRAQEKGSLCNLGHCSKTKNRTKKIWCICDTILPLHCFYKNKNRPDGLCHLCKECDNKKRLARAQKQYLTNIQYKLSMILRTRMNQAIKSQYKSGSAIRDLGCSILELKVHLEKQFTDNMSWDNWGINGWHIDHIIPLSQFDLTNHEQFLKACHYTNLQPLWATDNLKKSSKL